MTRPARRTGLSLLEVIVALSVMLLALVALGQLVTTSSDTAADIRRRSEALQLCQSRLAEVVAGAVPLQSTGAATLEENPDWEADVVAEPDAVAPNLYRVRVSVRRTFPDNQTVEVSLSRLLLDPAARGSPGDTAAADAAAAASATSGASGTGSTTGGTSP